MAEFHNLLAIDAWENLGDMGVYTNGAGAWGELTEQQGSGAAKVVLLDYAETLAKAWESFSNADMNQTLVYDDWLNAALLGAFKFDGRFMQFDETALP